MSAPALPLIRQWAIANNVAGVGQRGPVGHDAQAAYAQAHGLPVPERQERPPREAPAAPARRAPRVFRGASCPACRRRWEGLKECHCSRCHLHFRSEVAFDAHLRVTPEPFSENTECVDPLSIVYRSGPKKGERKFREMAVHHGFVIVRAEERPDQEEIQSR